MNKLTTEIIESTKHKKIDDRVKDYLDKVISSLNQNNVEINDYTKLILLMIVNELMLYFKSVDAVYGNDEISSKDNYSRKAKMPEISIMQKSHDQILNLLDKLTLSPLESAKVKKLKRASDADTDAQELLDKLIS